MKNVLGLLAVLALAGNAWAGSVPNQITYQGTIKKDGIPVNGPVSLQIRLTNSNGTVVYWSGGNTTVQVAQGMFATVISPTGVDWQNVVPYIEVSVQGQVLEPRESLGADAYSLMSATVIDGAVTRAKLDPGVQDVLIPAGMVAMFAGPCPSGWTRFAALDNLFPMGASTYGTTGGSASHTHTISSDGAHDHGGITGAPTATDIGVVFHSGQGSGSHWAMWGTDVHRHGIGTDGAHSHGGQTGSTSTLPPYVTMVYCQKT